MKWDILQLLYYTQHSHNADGYTKNEQNTFQATLINYEAFNSLLTVGKVSFKRCKLHGIHHME